MGLLDSSDEDKAAASVMADLGFEETVQVVEEPSVPPQQQEEVQGFFDPLKEDLQQPPQETEDEELSEVERRLAKAQLYKQMISGSLFDGSGDIVEEVEQEFHAYARKQLQLLMGILAKEETPPLFTEEEVSLLRFLIESVRTRLDSQKKPLPKPALQTKPAKVAATVTLRQPTTPCVAKKEQPKKPQLKTRAVPEEVPSTKKTTTQSSKTQPKKPTPEIRLPPKLTVPSDGSEIEEDGRRFRVKHVEMPDVDEYGIMDGTKIRRLSDQGTCVLSNGIQIAKFGTTVVKVLKTSLSPVIDVPGRVPFPSKEQMSVITAAMSQAQAERCLPPSLNAILKKDQ